MSLFNKDARENQLGASLADMALHLSSFGSVDNTGASDVTSFIANAISTSNAQNKALLIPDGTYLVNQVFTVNVGLIGTSRGNVTFKLVNNSTIPLTGWLDTRSIFVIGSDNAVIENIVIDGNNANNRGTSTAGVAGIYAKNKNGLRIRNITTKNTRDKGMHLENVPDLDLRHFVVDNCGRYGQEMLSAQVDRIGVLLDNTVLKSDSYFAKHVTVQHGKITNCGLDGLVIGANGIYHNVRGDYNGQEMFHTDPGAGGIYIRPPQITGGEIDHVLLSHCQTHYNTGLGIDCGNNSQQNNTFKNVSIHHCLSSYNNRNGIGLAGMQYSEIMDCISWNNGQQITNNSDGQPNYNRCGIVINAMNLQTTTNIKVMNNTCYDDQATKTQYSPVNIFNGGSYTCGNILIHNNQFDGNINNEVTGYSSKPNTTGYLSIQNNTGIDPLNQTPVNNGKVYPINQSLNLTPAGAINLNGIENGVIGDIVMLKNTTTNIITLVNSNTFLLRNNMNAEMRQNYVFTFEYIGSGVWKEITRQHPLSAISYYQSTTQTLTSATYTKIQYQTSVYDNRGDFDATTNFRFTAKDTGYYSISVGVGLTSVPNGTRSILGLYKNGVLYKKMSDSVLGGSVASNTVLTESLEIQLNAGDYIEIWVNCGGAVTTIADSANTYLHVRKVS